MMALIHINIYINGKPICNLRKLCNFLALYLHNQSSQTLKYCYSNSIDIRVHME